ncbi:MAG: hypothetical protein ACYCYI_01725 [Saccharofermentanales bacterium]
MPGSMIHLLTAYKVNPSANVCFWIGNIAPDAVSDWQEKEIKHFRNFTDRTDAMKNLASKTDRTDSFAEGILLHLFLDWKWDVSVRDDFMKNTGEYWFSKYRDELSLAGGFMYHHVSWSKIIWEQMDLYDVSTFKIVDGATNLELKNFISRNKMWHSENNIGPSIAFIPEMIESFTDKVAEEYVIWRKSV